LEWSCRYPDDFKSLVLINSSAANLSLPWEGLNWKLLPTLLKAASQKDPVLREKAILMLTSNLSKDKLDSVAKEWATFAAPPKQLRLSGLRQLAAAIAFKAPAKNKINVPVLVLSSMKDRFTSSKCSYSLARYYGFSQAVHPNTGHDLTLDDPDWVVEQVRLFSQNRKGA
jgi:pimeloyl-ACP methyl ester carboxylesterase